MHNPTRRNRNIGTKKQGYSKNNYFKIPQPNIELKSFYERLEKYQKEKRIINGREFVFVTEQTRKTSEHACSIDDIEKIIRLIPTKDYGELQLIILRQPKRKEEIISPVWGRLIYSYEFEDEYMPAIIIEAADYSKSLKWPKKLTPDAQQELDRLRNDGHEIVEEKRYFLAKFNREHVRKTQLYRTLLHEFGHYVHYLEFVVRPGSENEAYEEWEKRDDNYFNLPKIEKEKFAHNYAAQLRKQITEQ